jgi:DNA-binding MarR family transcriptional regulator
MFERDEQVRRIIAAQHRMQHLMAADPSNPLLQSTLTMQQLKMLLVLSHTGGSSGQDLAAAMGVTLATVTGIVDRLVASGLVDRREDPHDRRVRRVRLTDAGHDTIDGIITAGQESLLALLRRLGDDDLHVVEQAMVLLTDAAAAHLAEHHPGTGSPRPPAGRAAPHPRHAAGSATAPQAREQPPTAH